MVQFKNTTMLFLYPIFFILPTMATARVDCSKEAYGECVQIADPLIKEPRLIFPDKMEDIDIVCHTWNKFVDCLKFYTDNCFTEQQRRQFNKAVENPIESLHQLCTDSNYQQEYLKYASCIKGTITERIHCGPHYHLLVEQVAQGDIISKSTLCCSHDRFKQCVNKETRRLCDRGVPNGPATRFANHLIEKALSYLQEQCFNYIPSSGDCTSITTTNSQAFSDPLMISTSSSEIYPWSTLQDMAAKEILPSKVTPPKAATTVSWMPSSSLPIESVETSPSEQLGTRSRPASFGRASWSNTPNLGNTVQMYSDTPTTTAPSRPNWASVTSSWNPNTESHLSTKWYPAEGAQEGNEVDEPNQQGWAKPKNGAQQIRFMTAMLSFGAVLLVIC